ncbi:MAG: glycoside hydrolase family 28 protein [Ignisphaera sp.]|uniref:Glycoside hydrolase family 28 protein n=1 Tax=Ignisphaera aggregans TaxID=334771 RepID=A0A7C4NMV1_9CREN
MLQLITQKISVIDYGADPRRGEDSSKAFNIALEEASEKKALVYIPPGKYVLSSPIILRNNAVILIEKDAVIEFIANYDNYPVVDTRREGIHQCQVSPLIFGKDVKNIAIIGEGTVDGHGERWWYLKKSRVPDDVWRKILESGEGYIDEQTRTWWPTKRAFEGNKIYKELTSKGLKPTNDVCEQFREFFRPQLLQLYNAENVHVYGVTFRNSPMWNIHILYSKHITVENVNILAPDYSPNTDGIAVDSSSDVYIRGCLIDVGDDCIVLKSGKNEEGRRIGIPTTNVFVSNCLMRRGHGGFVIGSEMSGCVRNVSIENSVFEGTERGIRIKTTRGRGGIVENVIARNITMKDIIYEAIVIDMFYEPVPPEPVSERTPIIRNIHIQNITCYSAGQAIKLAGLPEMPISDVVIENTRINAVKGVSISNTVNLKLLKVRVASSEGQPMVLENVRNISMEDCTAEKNHK